MSFNLWGRLFFVGALLAQILGVSTTSAGPVAQAGDPEAKARTLLETMTPEERVGQLFIVSFEGNQAPPESSIYDLIYTYHIGGVILERKKNNFVGAPSLLEVAPSLIRGLQEATSSSSQNQRTDPISGNTYEPVYIPLLVGVSQDGDGYPNDQILSGFSPLPSAMTLGATWQPDLAFATGELLGSELSALGINLLLGPSLDVLENPSPGSAGDISTLSFGGDPYWVAQMGQAYIAGVHEGSNNQIAVVVKHLPGYGGSDRPLDEEIPTIRKSLTELTQIELAPFFSVTGDAPDEASQTDAMLMAHIRYQGFQGNIRDTTRPVSFDPQAFSELMALDAFDKWRASGGLIISDSLGTRAVRRSYDASEQVFNGPLVARDAFLAGNDLLYLGDFISSGDINSYATIVSTVQFFAQKYREDAAFAERVDRAVTRVLTLKFKLYPAFRPELVLASASGQDRIGENQQLIFEIGRQAATLLSPDDNEIPIVLPETPRINDRILFIVDSYTARQCDVCGEESVVLPADFEGAVERLYGPGAGNLIAPGSVTSFSFHELNVALETIPGQENLLLSNLRSAGWVIIGLLDVSATRPDSMAFDRLLAERPDLIQGKKVIVFALNAPYYLDATDITKITAYYGLYSKQSQMADVAARLLFQEIAQPGAPPVSVAGTGYNLIEVTSPDPDRVVPLEVSRIRTDQNEPTNTPEEQGDVNETPTAGERIVFQAGDLLALSAGAIMDKNGNPVPDNTPVSFMITINTEGTPIQRQINTTTRSGIGQASYSIEIEGSMEILAQSGSPPATSVTQQFDVSGVNPEGIALQATQTAVAILQANAATESSSGDPGTQTSDDLLLVADLVDWFLAVVVSLFVSLLAYQTGSQMANVRWAVRWALATFIGGLSSTTYLALGMPGSAELLQTWGALGVVLITVFAAGFGWALAWIWKNRSRKRT
ncbi:MAG: hypothetical protein O3B43_02035 [Chloroflexi bacterium]|nr:hypothetical protein [Chloroflexota bacterium]